MKGYMFIDKFDNVVKVFTCVLNTNKKGQKKKIYSNFKYTNILRNPMKMLKLCTLKCNYNLILNTIMCNSEQTHTHNKKSLSITDFEIHVWPFLLMLDCAMEKWKVVLCLWFIIMRLTFLRGWTAVQFHAHVGASLGMNCNNFGDPPASCLVPSSNSISICAMLWFKEGFVLKMQCTRIYKINVLFSWATEMWNIAMITCLGKHRPLKSKFYIAGNTS